MFFAFEFCVVIEFPQISDFYHLWWEIDKQERENNDTE